MTHDSKRAIHTTISSENYHILMKYGNGVLCSGIENLINTANKKINHPSDVCFNCKYWETIEKICNLIDDYPTNSEYCKMFIRN